VTCHSSWDSMTTAVAKRRNDAGFGKISTTSARRLISLFSRSIGLFDQVFCQCAFGKHPEREHVFFRAAHHCGDFRKRLSQRVADLIPLLCNCIGFGVREDRLDRRHHRRHVLR